LGGRLKRGRRDGVWTPDEKGWWGLRALNPVRPGLF
jgi:hypothetical protein